MNTNTYRTFMIEPRFFFATFNAWKFDELNTSDKLAMKIFLEHSNLPIGGKWEHDSSILPEVTESDITGEKELCMSISWTMPA